MTRQTWTLPLRYIGGVLQQSSEKDQPADRHERARAMVDEAIGESDHDYESITEMAPSENPCCHRPWVWGQ